MWGTGTGSEVMKRIATPMVGGMISTVFISLVVLPVLYVLIKQWSYPAQHREEHESLIDMPSGEKVT
jgi:Cu(I)/Ag(I) efflux system membrane protein CusA/SilA